MFAYYGAKEQQFPSDLFGYPHYSK